MRTTRTLLATLAIVSLAACTQEPTAPRSADAASQPAFSTTDSTSTTDTRQGGPIGSGN